jgi:transcriptional regulator with XRE-family HTH domain
VSARTCSFEGCEDKHAAKGYCRGHYNRFHRYGDPSYNGREGIRSLCAFEGCGREAKARGFCEGHYLRVRTSADLEHLLPEEARAERCFAPECEAPQHASGLCSSHRAILKRRGEAWTDVPPLLGFGGRLRAQRIRLGLTLKELADQTGYSSQRLHQLETQTHAPSQPVLSRLLAALGVEPESLIAGVDSRPAPKPGRPPKPVEKLPTSPPTKDWLEPAHCGFCGGTGIVYRKKETS